MEAGLRATNEERMAKDCGRDSALESAGACDSVAKHEKGGNGGCEVKEAWVMEEGERCRPRTALDG